MHQCYCPLSTVRLLPLLVAWIAGIGLEESGDTWYSLLNPLLQADD